MKPKTLILMVVAVTCGLGASYMTSRLLAQRGQGETEEKINILVASKDLPQGMMIKNPEETFIEKAFLRGTEPKEAVVKFEDLKGKVLKRSMKEGHYVTSDELLNEKDSGIAAMMAQGYRAMGVRVNLESTAGGFATLPLSRVDIISTVRRGSDKDSFSQVLLENVLVLAVDTQIHRDVEGRAMPGNVVTLALKPEDMLKVSIARELGPLSLALRKFNDHAKGDTDKVTVEQIMTKGGQKTDVDEEWTKVAGAPPKQDVLIPEAPKVAPKAADIVVAKEETPHKTHRLRIVEGDAEKVTVYRIDDKGEVIRNGAQGEAGLTPPRPVVVAPAPAPEAPAPEVPVPPTPERID